MEIRIPNIKYSTSTENVLVEVLSLMEKLRNCGDPIVLDFETVEFLHPFVLSSLSFYLKTLDDQISFKNISDNLNTYFNKIGFNSNIEFKNNILPDEILLKFPDSSFFPVCKFEKNYVHIDLLESILKRNILSELDPFHPSSDFKIGIAYLISELIDNIKEHSQASHGLVHLDLSDKQNLFISIADNGITILGSYISQLNPDPRILIGINNIQAINYSLNGVSTKNNRETHRGYGLSTNLDMVTNGLKGEFTLISGDSLFIRNNGEERLINLPINAGWEGTMILIKIPLGNHENFNYIKYIE